jgi:hypothetical protein
MQLVPIQYSCIRPASLSLRSLYFIKDAWSSWGLAVEGTYSVGADADYADGNLQLFL